MKILILPILMLSVLAAAQSPPTVVESDARKLADLFRAETANRSGNPNDLDSFARRQRHLVFLIDTSQVQYKPAYIAYVKTLVHRTLTILGTEQRDLGLPADSRHLVSVFPYESHAALDSPARAVPLRSANLDRIDSAIPTEPVPMAGWDGKGHDTIQALGDVLRQLDCKDTGTTGNAMGPFFIQISTSPISQPIPGQPTPLAKLNSTLANTGIVQYGPELNLKTDTPGGGLPPYEVYVWTYGPATLPAAHEGPSPPIDRSKIPFATILLVAIGIMVVGGLVTYFRPRSISLRGVSRKVGPTHPVPVVLRGGEGQKPSLVLGAPGDTSHPVAVITRSFFGSAQIHAEAPYVGSVDGHEIGEEPLVPGREYTFANQNDRLQTFTIKFDKRGTP